MLSEQRPSAAAGEFTPAVYTVWITTHGPVFQMIVLCEVRRGLRRYTFQYSELQFSLVSSFSRHIPHTHRHSRSCYRTSTVVGTRPTYCSRVRASGTSVKNK